MTFNLFGPPTKCDIKVGYISTDRGYVAGIGIHDANVYAKSNPGTTFIFATRERIRYLNINEINKLTPDDLTSQVDECKGIQMDKKSDDAPIKVIFMGGGGIGAQANPIIGRDGGVIGIDMVHRGFGYQYPPQVEVRDESGIAAGAVVIAGIGTTATVYQTYEDEEDFEVYDLDTCAPRQVGFGSVYNIDGKNIGSWNPNRYVNPSETPFQETVEQYIKFLNAPRIPWWTTRTEAPLKTTGDGKTTRNFYKVDFWYWKDFLNSYGISPVPKSNIKGSDFAGKWYTFEWNVDFPYDGDYVFRAQCDNEGRFFLDNEAVSDFKIGKGGAAGHVLSNPLRFKETVKKGKHNLRLELYNHHFREKFKVQQQGTGPQQDIRNEIQVAGTDFIKKSNGYFMKVGGNVQTEVTLKLTYNDNPKTAGTAITKIIIPNTDGPDLILEREKSGSSYKKSGSVTAKGVFTKSEEGYGPIQLFGNDGGSKLERKNVAYGAETTRYGVINFFDTHGTDINASLRALSAVNLQDSREVRGKITGLKSTETTEVVTVFNTVDYINKANRKLWRTNVYNRGGFLNEYGICPFDTSVALNDNPYAGTHKIVWGNVNFPVTGNYVIEIAVDDSVNLQIGDQVSIRKEGFKPGTSVGTGKYRRVHTIKQGNYPITADLDQITGGRFGFDGIKGTNPMALAINIETVYSENERIVQKSWEENPMSIAMTIEAPAPPIPQQPVPVQTGACPPNPFWTTRFPAKQQWHPVAFKHWPKFINKYAMSPVPPYDDKNTSGGGGIWINEWTIDVPYDGYYKMKGEVDDEAEFWIDGQKVLDLQKKRKGESKFFLKEGSKTIKVEIHNYKFEETKLIDQKIFNTSDWLGNTALPATKKSVRFKITSGSMFSNGIEIPELGINFAKEFTPVRDADGNILGQKGQLKEALVKEVEINKVYTIKVTSKETKQGVRLRAKGSVLQMEDHTDGDWSDIQCAASDGRFYDFKNGPNEATCKFIVTKPPKVSDKTTLVGGTIREGVTYEGPRLASYGSFPDMGKLFSPFHQDPQEIMGKSWNLKWKNVNFPESGTYTLNIIADDTLTVKIDGREVGFVKVMQGVRSYNFEVAAGKHSIEMKLTNIPAPVGTTFRTNPVVGGALITRKVRVGTGVLKPWMVNPVYVAAKLIPPPCPKAIGGKGTVDPVRPIDPGCGYRPPKGPGYPVGLKLTEIVITNKGINYNCAVDQVVIEPNEGGAKLSLCDCGPFGTINKVCVDDGGFGYTKVPKVRIISDTGINAELVPVFETVRDPVGPAIDQDKLIQVTDLVGVKQTGYYEGRAYYGAIFYKEGVKYAGYYETPGELVQIYDTMQESIDGMVTTPPSAILRQGTDISSDDPNLNIPGTPDNLV